jgi:hypothetical protein
MSTLASPSFPGRGQEVPLRDGGANRLPLQATLKAVLSCFQIITISDKMQQKSPAERLGVDKIKSDSYTKIIERALPVDGQPPLFTEVTAVLWGQGRLLLFAVVNLDDQVHNADEHEAELKQL